MIDAASPFAGFARVLNDRDAIAARAIAQGRKVVGYMGSTVPVELIEAAGMLPFPLTATPRPATPLADRYMENLFDPRVRLVFEALLEGSAPTVDLIVVPRTSDSLQRFYYYLGELKRTGVAALPAVKLYDLLHTPAETSAVYNRARTQELFELLQDLAGRPVSPADLASAIAASNARRAALEAMIALRRARPARISGQEALAVFEASRLMPAETFTAALNDAVANASDRAFAGPRLVVAGSQQDRPDLHRLIEALGAVVVGDFHATGELMLGAPIDTAQPPLDALSQHYHRTVASSRRYPSRPADLAEFAVAAGAEGVVFFYDAEEEALTWDFPGQRRAAQGAGLQVLAFPDQPYPLDEASTRPALQSFITDLRQGAAA